ncbi:MAG: serine hydrolase, partial [Anaerolineae bacterium]|nr:serine hydrolase [Anaerolineae bacterium]
MTPQTLKSPPSPDIWPTAGWQTASPADQGLDAQRLNAAVEHLDARYPHLDSLLIVRGGYMVLEHDRARAASAADIAPLRNIKSVTKSVLAALLGIAIQIGDLGGLHDTLGELLPEQFTTASDPRTRAITVEHLLTMRSGLEWAEWEGSTQHMTASPDWVRFVLDRPLAHDPGAVFNYSTGDTHLLAAILQKATGMTALAYADLYLFGPLGIERRRWTADPQGISIGGAELALTPRDMAKFGFLVLNHGQWDGQPVLPAAWVHAMMRPRATVFSGETDGKTDGSAPPDDCARLEYGYLWWLRKQGDHASALAVGYGGQYIYVIPALDLVIVLTGDLSAGPRAIPPAFRDNRMLCQFDFVADHILPA